MDRYSNKHDLAAEARRAIKRNNMSDDPEVVAGAVYDKDDVKPILRSALSSFSPRKEGDSHWVEREFETGKAVITANIESTVGIYAKIIELAGGKVEIENNIPKADGVGIELQFHDGKKPFYICKLGPEQYMRASAAVRYDCSSKLPREYEKRWEAIQNAARTVKSGKKNPIER